MADMQSERKEPNWGLIKRAAFAKGKRFKRLVAQFSEDEWDALRPFEDAISQFLTSRYHARMQSRAEWYAEQQNAVKGHDRHR